MAVQSIATLKANMPINTAGAISAQDINDLIDTTEDRTTQDVITITGTTRAIALTENRRTFVYNNAAAGTFTLPNNLPAGFELAIVQIGAGQAAISVTGGNLRHPDNHTRTSKQWAVIYCKVYANAGTSPQVLLTGDTAV